MRTLVSCSTWSYIQSKTVSTDSWDLQGARYQIYCFSIMKTLPTMQIQLRINIVIKEAHSLVTKPRSQLPSLSLVFSCFDFCFSLKKFFLQHELGFHLLLKYESNKTAVGKCWNKKATLWRLLLLINILYKAKACF